MDIAEHLHSAIYDLVDNEGEGRMMEIKDLKPCPFCGGKATRTKATIKDAEDSIGCLNEYCPMWNTMSPEDWNTRAAHASQPQEGPRSVLGWFERENPMLGGVSPLNMIKIGRGDKLCKWIVNQIDENAPPSTAQAEDQDIGDFIYNLINEGRDGSGNCTSPLSKLVCKQIGIEIKNRFALPPQSAKGLVELDEEMVYQVLLKHTKKKQDFTTDKLCEYSRAIRQTFGRPSLDEIIKALPAEKDYFRYLEDATREEAQWAKGWNEYRLFAIAALKEKFNV